MRAASRAQMGAFYGGGPETEEHYKARRAKNIGPPHLMTHAEVRAASAIAVVAPSPSGSAAQRSRSAA